MLGFLLTFSCSLAFASFVGYWIHRSLHKPWTGPLYKAHQQHHELYPPGDLVSDEYRDAKWYNRGISLFTPAFMLIILLVGLGARFFGTSFDKYGIFVVTLAAYGLLNDWVHDKQHLRKHWLHRLPFAKSARAAHLRHHGDVNYNYGIVSSEWDKAFKTLKDT